MKPPSQPNAINKLFQGNQSPASALFGQPDPSQPPQPQSAPPTASPSQQPPAPPQAQPQADSAPPQRGAIAQSMQPQMTDPASVQNPYQVPQHGTLAKIILGVGEAFGNPLASRIGERDRQLQEQHNEFEATGRQKTAAELNRESMQTAEAGSNIQRSQYEMGKEQETAKANAVSQIQQEVESGKYGTGDALLGRWRRIAQANPHIGLTDEDIQGAITSTHPIGPKYSVTKGEGGRPEGLQDREGNVYTADKIPQDPEAQSIWANATTGHEQARGEKREDEAYVAGKAAERQAAGFQQANTMEATKKMQPAVDTALTADDRLARMEKSFTKGMAGDQQAQLALLADHLGMTFGMQKGAKLNRGLIEEAQQSQPWLAKISAKFDKDGYLSGVALGPEQMKQMLDLGYDARDRAWQGAHNTATTYGVALPPGAEKVEQQRQPGSKPMLQQQGGQGGAKQPPQGATHIGTSSLDGKKYYLDAQGKKLGPAE
jgi:hypothetical protein